jgi:hypothetical protein
MNMKTAWLLAAALVTLVGWLPGAQATGGMHPLTVAASRPAPQAVGTPRITKAMLEKKQLLVEGENFADGVKLLVNGEKVKAVPDEMSPATRLIVNKANRRLPVDEIVGLQVRNLDGQTSATWMLFTGLVLTHHNTADGAPVFISAGRKFLLRFSDQQIIWQLYYPPSQSPVVEFLMPTEEIISGSQGLYRARNAGYAPFEMDAYPQNGNPPFRHSVNLFVE